MNSAMAPILSASDQSRLQAMALTALIKLSTRFSEASSGLVGVPELPPGAPQRMEPLVP